MRFGLAYCATRLMQYHEMSTGVTFPLLSTTQAHDQLPARRCRFNQGAALRHMLSYTEGAVARASLNAAHLRIVAITSLETQTP